MSYRYIGNKTRLLPFLMESFGTIISNGATVADLMCGTASVSEALRKCGYQVIASDIMTFAVYHAKVRLLLSKSPEFPGIGIGGYEKVVEYLNHIEPIEGLFYKEYSSYGCPENGTKARMYFSGPNAAKIDSILKQINDWDQDELLSDYEKSLLHHDLVLASNRVANIAGTYGHHRSVLSKAAILPLKIHPSKFLDDFSTAHLVYQGAAEDIAPLIEADLCYIDPPYMKRQYAANYHILETIARGDHPDAVGVSGLRPWRDQYSDFCSKVKIRDAFRKIFQSANCEHFMVSYSEDGLLKLSDLLDLFSEFGNTTLKKVPFQRFRSNDGGKGGVVLEYLFHIKV